MHDIKYINGNCAFKVIFNDDYPKLEMVCFRPAYPERWKLYLNPAKKSRHTTAMIFPRKAERGEERRAQRLNYDSFIHVMADMLDKYAGDFLE